MSPLRAISASTYKYANSDVQELSRGALSSIIVLEKYTGFNTSPVLECLAQYFLSKKTPLRIDLMSAILTEVRCAGLGDCVVRFCGVYTDST